MRRMSDKLLRIRRRRGRPSFIVPRDKGVSVAARGSATIYLFYFVSPRDVEPVLINADAPCKLTTSCEIERRFYAMRWKVIIRHYRPGNGYTACRRSLDSVCDVIMFIVPSGRLLGNLGNDT